MYLEILKLVICTVADLRAERRESLVSAEHTESQ